MTTTVTVQQDHFRTLHQSYLWDEKIHTILQGSIKSSVTATAISFEDRWAGGSVEGVISGGFVTQITIRDAILASPWTGQAGRSVIDAVVIDIGPGSISASDLTDGLARLYKKSAGNPLKDMMADDFIFQSVDTYPQSATDAHDRFKGYAGDDIFRLGDSSNDVTASGGDDRIEGGSGLDNVNYTALAQAGLKGGIDSRAGTGGTWEIVKPGGGVDTLLDVESVFGTNFRDDLKAGLGRASYINGANGRDLIGGSNAADSLDGGNGDDRLWGRQGDDVLIGGYDVDVLRGGAGRDVLVAGTGYGLTDIEPDQLFGNGGRDLFVLDLPTLIAGTFFGQNNGPAVIRDYADGMDFIGIAGPGFGTGPTARFSDLDIRQAGGDTIIVYEGLDLARLQGVAASDLTRRDFVLDVDVVAYALQWDIPI